MQPVALAVQGIISRASNPGRQAWRRYAVRRAGRSGPDWQRQGWNRWRDQWRRQCHWCRVGTQLSCDWHGNRWRRSRWATQHWHRAACEDRRGFAQAFHDWRQRCVDLRQLLIVYFSHSFITSFICQRTNSGAPDGTRTRIPQPPKLVLLKPWLHGPRPGSPRRIDALESCDSVLPGVLPHHGRFHCAIKLQVQDLNACYSLSNCFRLVIK
jgi:hypothetical protein